MEKTPVNHNPFLQGQVNLFDLTDEAEGINKKTPKELSDAFLSLWMEVYDPFMNFPDIFPVGEEIKAEIELSHVRNFYIKAVINNKWSDEKYVLVLEALYNAKKNLNSYSLEQFGKMYDNNQLEFQLAEKRRKRKRI